MEKKLVALTFDDGPSDTMSDLVMDQLEKYNIPATFFLIGEQITPERIRVIERELSLGCEIENHSWTHSDMTKFTKEQMRDEISRTSEIITSVTGREPVFFRPPYICVNDDMFDVIDLTFICGIGSEDWISDTTPEHRAQKTFEGMRDGALVLLHDFEGNFNTVKALDIIVPELLEQGYEFVTLEQLFLRKGIDPRKADRVLFTYTDQQGQ
ncbi:MAG: xylanase deacetylase [Ruminococcaceae bacterium]|nr:xylanase deacetylase [Oscillospiraceae bacterium]